MATDKGLGSAPIFSASKGQTKHFDHGVHFIQQWVNVCFIETSDGVVVYDAGFMFTGAQIVKEVREITDKPIRYIIYSHGHADHAFGTQHILNEAEKKGHPKPIIIAHENCVKRFDRYREMLPYHEHINRIQFAIPDNVPAFAQHYVYPDMTFRDEITFKVGDTIFELKHHMGETDDAIWLWVPEKKVVCVSDLWVWSCPNIGNPFKVQRYEVEWADGLEAIAGKNAELMLPGHGLEIKGKDEIVNACTTVARALRFLHDQVVGMLNEGKWQEEILHSFEWPEEYAKSPYLRPIYGHPYFIVQAILRRYHGWHDGNPSHLFPSHSKDIAAEVLKLGGEPANFMERAKALAGDGKHQLALHLVDFVIDGGTDIEKEALELKKDLLRKIADKETSFIARNIFLGGVRGIDKKLKGK